MLCCYSATTQPFPTANTSTAWTINGSIADFEIFSNVTTNTRVKFILHRKTNESRFACGFYCKGACTSYLFGIFILPSGLYANFPQAPEVVWSANRDHVVAHNATLNFTASGELVLQDADGSPVWTSNTTGKSVVGMNLTDHGNLILFDVNNMVVWQSFDHPTDCLLLGQKLFQGQKLIPSVSETNWTAQEGLFSLQVTDKGLIAYVDSNPPQVYYSKLVPVKNTSQGKSYARFLNGSLSLFLHSAEPSHPVDVISMPQASSQFIKLMSDGHLKLFEFQGDWTVVADLLTSNLGECGYHMACGRNVVCSSNQQCSCPVSTSSRIDYFRALNYREPSMGCSEITPLTCNATHDQAFIAIHNVSYFTFGEEMEDYRDMKNVNLKACKKACMDRCSCKVALFRYGSDSLSGTCYLPSDIFTITAIDERVWFEFATAFIKVRNVKSPSLHASQRHDRSLVAAIAGSAIGSSVLLLILIVGFLMFIKKRNVELEEEYIDQVQGMPTRFSYEELKTATNNFSKKLGQGGFGAVFEGTLTGGSKIAVKCLEGFSQVNKSFLAEVESIGSVHHVNLVRLRGFFM
ncbi:Apple-like protein [Artemisia annua]|uniref:Apple-like protein n=1 Tax=Artemisia annua TaxID=35608 RepID=A0A2U1KAR9_ARTAN|nr:Apple-like protein [Artemisia annua]